MCGIIGYAGHRPAVPLLIDGLRRLEYRGYDSAGVAYLQNKELHVIRAEGKLNNLENCLSTCQHLQATSGLGHTRWATHGLPTTQNAHPHQDEQHKFALVHNGIIENFQELKHALQDKGHTFASQTDTEVIVHLLAENFTQHGSLGQALAATLEQIEGSYALACIHRDFPNEIWAARHASPLLLGVGQGENFVASDIPAFLGSTREVVFLEDDEMVRLTPNSWEVFTASKLQPIAKSPHRVEWDLQAAQKGGYKHFMLKEIMEQPKVIQDGLAGRIDEATQKVVLQELHDLPLPQRLHIIACGTSFHAGLWAKYLIEEWARIPVQVEVASEFRYRQQVFQDGDLALAISQSGETADTLAGLRIARTHNLPVLGLCNVVGSSVAREADGTIYTQAGPEISVASTKAMCSQMIALLLLALFWGRQKNTLPIETAQSLTAQLLRLPQTLSTELERMQHTAQRLTPQYSKTRSFFFLGRGLGAPLALEGALKLKEISYIHAEGYAAGEMKHGPIALIDAEFPTFALAPQDTLLPKVSSNLQEVQARGGKIIALTNPGTEIPSDDRWELPHLNSALDSFLFLPALQLFAYEMAVYLGKDVDQPRNLAKSVTVE
ncbi:MAG: glutamine--fructose-6-phosphate transaminase (isomerizing) [Thermodesulfobacteriota bacterium]